MKKLLLLVSCFVVLSKLNALPTGFELQQGAAQMEQSGSGMLIQSQQDSVIHWQDFSIEKLESVQFLQRGADSIVLNRVMGDLESCLNGQLISNGQIYLINQNGIVVGADAQIFSAGFVASTQNVIDEQVLKGAEIHFSGDSSKSILNLGTIVCPTGSIALIAKKVENRGIIEAPEGEVSLGGGVDLWLRPEGRQRISICPTNGDGEVLNVGEIKAISIQLEADGNPYAYGIRTEGKLSTYRIENEKGRILLKARNGQCQVQGELTANGERGGEISVFANEIHVGTAKIEANGSEEGGFIRIGGDCHGEVTDGFNAEKIWISSNTTISADAIESGDGGRVVVWGNQWTSHHGQISARGGAFGGNGGWIEVSSPGSLNIEASLADTRAPLGRTGTLLLDPSDITISADMDTDGSFGACTPPSSWTPTAATSNIQASSLETQLGTCSVLIDTSLGAFGSVGNVSITSSVSWSSANSLQITADGQISISDGVIVSNSGSGDIIFIANNAGTTPFSGIGINIIGDISNSGGGQITLSGRGGATADPTRANGVFLSANATVSSSSGTIQITGVGGSTSGSGNGDGVVFAGGSVLSSNTGSIQIMGTGSATGLGHAGVITHMSSNISTTNASITVNGMGGAGLSAAGVIVTGGISAGGNGGLTVTGSGTSSDVQVAETATFQSANGDLTINANSGMNSNNFSPSNSTIQCTGSGNLTINAIGLVLSGSQIITSTGNLTVTANRIFITQGRVRITTGVTGLLTLYAMVNALSIANSSGSFPIPVQTGGGDINLIGNTGILFNDSAGAVQIASDGGAIHFFNPVTVSLPLTVSTNFGGNVNFDGTISGGQSLTIPEMAGTVTFAGAVGTLSSVSVNAATINQNSTATTTGSLSYTASTAINLNGGITTSGGAVSLLTGPVTLNSSLTINTASGAAAGAAITVNNNITQAASQNLTLNAGTGGTVGIGGNLTVNQFTLTNSGNTTITGTTTVPTVVLTNTAGTITFTGAVSVSTAFTTAGVGYNVLFSNGGTITPATTFSNTGSVTLQSGGSPNLTFTNGLVHTTGATTMLGTIRATTAAAAVSVNALTFSSGTSTLTTNAGAVTAGAITLSGIAAIDTTNGGGTPGGANIPLSTVNGAGSLTLTGGTGGTVSFSAVGASVQPASLTASGVAITQNSTVQTVGAVTYTGAIGIGGSITTSTGAIAMNGAVTLNADSTMQATSGGAITYSSTVNGNRTLVVNSGTQNTTFSGAVGNSVRLGVLNVTGNLINVTTNISAQGGTLIFNSPVVLLGDTVFSDIGNTGISFLSTITGNFNLTIDATNGSASVAGNIDTSGTTGGNVTISGVNGVTIEGDVATNGTTGGDVDISSTSGSVLVQGINTSGTTGNAGDITLQPDPSFSTGTLGTGTLVPNGRLAVYGALNASSTSGTGGTISLSATGRTEIMSVATIYGDPAGGDLNWTGDLLVMGANEATTAFGAISLNFDSSAQVGDMISTDGISITSPTIELLLHGSGQILDFQGIPYTTENLHFLSTGTVTLIGLQMPVGTGPDPDIAFLSQFTPAEFASRLIYMGYSLNFDIDFPATATSSSTSVPLPFPAIYKFVIANTQIPYYWPSYPEWKNPKYKYIKYDEIGYYQ